jgi:hypothetical protein
MSAVTCLADSLGVTIAELRYRLDDQVITERRIVRH